MSDTKVLNLAISLTTASSKDAKWNTHYAYICPKRICDGQAMDGLHVCWKINGFVGFLS